MTGDANKPVNLSSNDHLLAHPITTRRFGRLVKSALMLGLLPQVTSASAANSAADPIATDIRILRSTLPKITVPPTVNTFSAIGYHVVGIGASTWTRTTVSSTNPSLVRDASGAFFEMADPSASIEAFGALASDFSKPGNTHYRANALAFNQAFAYAAWRAAQKVGAYTPPVAEIVTIGPGLFVLDAGAMHSTYAGNVAVQGTGSASSILAVTTTISDPSGRLTPRTTAGLNLDVGTQKNWPVKTTALRGLSIIDFEQGAPTDATLLRCAHFDHITFEDIVLSSGYGIAFDGYKNFRYAGAVIATSSRNTAVRLNGANGQFKIRATNLQNVASGSTQQVSYGPPVHLTGACRSMVLDIMVGGAGALRNYSIASLKSDNTGFTATVRSHDFRAHEIFIVSGCDTLGYNGVWRVTSVGPGTVRVTDAAAANLGGYTIAGFCSSEVGEIIWDSEDEAGGGESVISIFAESGASGPNAQGLDKVNKACFGLILDGSRNPDYNGNPAGLYAIKARVFSDAGFSTVLLRGAEAPGGYSLCREISFDDIYSRVEGCILQIEGFCYDIRAPNCSFQAETPDNNARAFASNTGYALTSSSLFLRANGGGQEPDKIVFGLSGAIPDDGAYDVRTIPAYGILLDGSFARTLDLTLLGCIRGRISSIGPRGTDLSLFRISTRAAELVTGTTDFGQVASATVDHLGLLDLAAVGAYNSVILVSGTASAITVITGGFGSRSLRLVGKDGPLRIRTGGNVLSARSGPSIMLQFDMDLGPKGTWI